MRNDLKRKDVIYKVKIRNTKFKPLTEVLVLSKAIPFQNLLLTNLVFKICNLLNRVSPNTLFVLFCSTSFNLAKVPDVTESVLVVQKKVRADRA